MGAAKLVQTILNLVLTVVGWIMVPLTDRIFAWWYDTSAQIVPPVTDDMLLSSATVISQNIRSRTVNNLIEIASNLFVPWFRKLFQSSWTMSELSSFKNIRMHVYAYMNEDYSNCFQINFYFYVC